MEKIILSFLDWIRGVDFATIFQLVGIGFLLFWVVVIGWVISDSRDRFSSKWLQALAVAVVILLPLFGLLIYFIVRPRITTEDEEMATLEKRYLKFEAAGLGDCPTCGYELMPNFVFCPECGRELRYKCDSCDIYLEPSWKTCPFCGTKRVNASHDDNEMSSLESALVKASLPDSPVAKEFVTVSTNAAGALGETQDLESLDAVHNDSLIKEDGARNSASSVSVSETIAKKNLLKEADGFVKYIGALPMKLLDARSRARKPKVATSVPPLKEDFKKKKKKKSSAKKRKK